MEQDEEVIKKLMTILSSRKQLTYRDSKSKKTFKIIALEDNQQTQIDTINFLNQPHLDQSPITSKNIILPLQSEVHEVQQDDFKLLALERQKCQKDGCLQQKRLHDISINNIDLDIKIQIELGSQRKQAQICHHLDSISISAIKPRKVVLGSKNKSQNKPANEVVLNFIQSRKLDPNKTHIFQSQKLSSTQSTQHVSFDVGRSQQTSSKRYLTSSKTVNQQIQYLKSQHPQNSQSLELISRRLNQLQNLVLERDISQILSASLSSSFRYDSFDISILSNYRLGLNSDPLCEMFAQYLKRNQSEKNSNKNISASFIFLYSQPMLDIHGAQIDEQINYFQEQSIIQKILKSIKCKIQYIRERATMDKFHYWMKQSVQILHFCGHGVQQKENYLLFQSNSGKSVKMDSEAIGKILAQIKTKLKLVFVASCHSQSTGKLFCEAGVDHVVCVKNDHVILDTICQQFVRIFYKSCIHDRMKICQSFKFAKKQLQLIGSYSKHQIQKFIILHNHDKKPCPSELTIYEDGQFKDLTFKPFYNKILPSRVQNFIPRPKDLHEVLKLIDSKKRFITIMGMSGIGKSTLVRQLVRYIQFRNLFIDGVVYLELRGCENMGKIIQTLDTQLFQSPTLKHNRSLYQNTQKLVKQLNKRHILIVMDNCQHIMNSDDKEHFKKLIESVMKNCDDTYFIFTHRTSLSRQIDYCSQKIYQLKKLNQRQSYNLFFQAIPRNIDKMQLGDFFKIEKGIKQISKHPIFQFLNGHPEAIVMTASLLSDRSLSQLYEVLLKPVQYLSNQFGIQQKKLSDDIASNKFVQTAMKISLNVCKNKNKEAYEIIKILSMLPRGLQTQMMPKILAKNYNQHLSKLKHYSLVKVYEKGAFKYHTVHPNIIACVQSQIDTQQRLRYHQKICQQYLKRCQRIYKNVGTLSGSSQRLQEMFLNQEDNYKAIILRELSIYGQSSPLKRLYIQLFQGHYFTPTYSSPSSYEQEETFHNQKPLIDLSDFESYFNQSNKRAKFIEKMKQPTKKQHIMLLVVYYVTNLFVIKKANFCQKYIEYGVYLAVKKNMLIVSANLIRLKGCIELAKNNCPQARQYFQLAWEMFAIQGCGLGAASCQGAVGYIKFIEEQYAMAKMNLQNALKYYGQIDHPFGKHYMNRWLCMLKSKMNRTQNQLINHKKQAQKLIKQAKTSLKSSNINNTSICKHKLGYFVFRFLFMNMSIFLQASFQADVKPKLINQIIKKNINEKTDKPILTFQRGRQEKGIIIKKQQEKNKQAKQQKSGGDKQEKPLKSTMLISKYQGKDEIKQDSDANLLISSPKIQTVAFPKYQTTQASSNTQPGLIGSKKGQSSKTKKIQFTKDKQMMKQNLKVSDKGEKFMQRSDRNYQKSQKYLDKIEKISND